MRSIRMKTVVVLGALLALGMGLSGCGGGGETEDDTASRLVATWRLVKVSGGFTGNGQTETPNEQLTFNPNGTFQRTVNGVNSTGTYTILQRKTIFNNETEAPVITYTPQALPDVITTVDNAHLAVNEEAADGYTREYERVAP